MTVVVNHPTQSEIEAVFVDEIHHHVGKDVTVFSRLRMPVKVLDIRFRSGDRRRHSLEYVPRGVQMFGEDRLCSCVLEALKESFKQVPPEAVMRE